MKRLAFAILVLALPRMALAQQAADMKLISDCLKNADTSGNVGTGCIGLVADACTRKAANDAAKAKGCAQRELLVWNALTEAAARRVRAGGFRDISKALAESEKAWTQQRDTLCPVFDRIDPGTLPGDAAYCRMQTTANRTLLLRKLGAAVNER